MKLLILRATYSGDKLLPVGSVHEANNTEASALISAGKARKATEADEKPAKAPKPATAPAT